ncbi:MAG: hypothetical protein IPJ61_21750, partial [Tessaracoccus sp.]|uniref:hypothetical protein n=1 Tax=Tessaracoccus sp. TaxID=1971211 RepID=UPI001EBAF61E
MALEFAGDGLDDVLAGGIVDHTSATTAGRVLRLRGGAHSAQRVRGAAAGVDWQHGPAVAAFAHRDL